MAFLSFNESIENLFESMDETTFYEMVFLDDSLGYILAEDIVADQNSPQFLTSAMDGYAIKFIDQMLGRLSIQANVPAGTFSDEEVVGGMCIKVFTGSLMPKGSDTLIPIENVTVDGDAIVINEEVPKGFSVRPIGENYKKGEVLITKGMKIGFAEIGVLASLNISQVKVYKKPVVSIIATGSEILDVGQKETNPSQIRSSNQFTLEALARQAGANVLRTPLAKDDKNSIKTQIDLALANSDIVVTTGGVSVGDYDFVKEILADLDAEYIANGVVIKPGQHIKIVKVGKKYIFALPGFPYSSTVTFILYVIPVIKAMMGRKSKQIYKKARLRQNYKKKSNKTEFAVANLTLEDGVYQVDFIDKRSGSSAILTNMLGACALIKIDEKDGDLSTGDSVDFIDLNTI